MKKSSIYLLALLFTLSCKRNIDTIIPPTINPSDVNLLSQYITLARGAFQQTGNLPIPDNIFSITGLNSSIISSNGSTASIVLRVDPSVLSDITGYFINIEGSDIFYSVPLSAVSSDGTIVVPIGLPTVLEAGNFCVNVMTYNSQNQTSNIVQQCLDVVRLGSGSLQINLAWDTDYTDVDLHVIDPSGFEIYYSNPYSYGTGGQLDRDDTNGFGPENIFWNESAPDGDYRVYIVYYSGGPVTRNYITINGERDSRSFNKSLSSSGQTEFITKIRKSGNRLTFLNENTQLNKDLELINSLYLNAKEKELKTDVNANYK